MKRISFNIGNKVIGNSSCLIQTMADKKTSNTKYNINLTNNLEKMSLDMMRFSILDKKDASSLLQIKKNVNIPIIADIHFDYNLALEAIKNKVDKIRINPGNINSTSGLRQIINECKKNNIPIRIGCNSGSINKYKGKTSSIVDDYFLALDETLEIFKEENFSLLVLSLKSSNPELTNELYEKAYKKYPYPLHIGLTESGYGLLGGIKSTWGLYNLLKEGIGDTIRVSLSSDRKEELRACKELLRLSKRKDNIPELIACPTCGRTKVDVKPLSRLVQDKLDYVNKNIKIAIMGCPVNGIGEGKDADYGITGLGKKNTYLIFSKGITLGQYTKDEAIKKLFELIDCFK